MNMTDFIRALRAQLVAKPEDEPILKMLFECYNEQSGFDNDRIRQDFEALYAATNSKPLQEQDEVVYATCALCQSHAESGFIEGIRVGMRLAQEVGIAHE